MLSRTFLVVGFLCAGASISRAELIERDLGEGLKYYRAHSIPADLPSAAAKPGALVLDLRFASAENEADTALDAWLKFRATPSTPVIVLVNSQTATTVRELIASRKTGEAIVVLGSSSPEGSPDIAIKENTESERRAYDALEHGASVDSLITENASKPRIDEASIMHDRANPVSEFAEDEPAELSDTPATPPAAESSTAAVTAPGPVVIDSALQRAVHLHRGLAALKRLSPK